MSGHGHGNKSNQSHERGHSNTQGSAGAGHPGYEPTDAKATPLIMFTVCLTVFTVACFFAGFVVYRMLEMGRSTLDKPVHPMAVERKITDGAPRLQIAEADDLAAYRKSADDKVNGYGWVDRGNSVVRVPVAKAMDLILKHKELKSRE